MSHHELVCPHLPPCPGCPRFGEGGISPDKRRRLDGLAKGVGLRGLRLFEGPATGYRHRARLAVRGRSNTPKIGIFQEGSHRIVDTPHCLVHHPLINQVAAALKDGIKTLGVDPYFDGPHKGLVRYLQVVVERRSETAQVVLVTNSETADPARPLLARLVETLGRSLHSLFWNGHSSRDNAILGPRWERIVGPEAVSESINGAEVFYPPGAFGQSNLPLADRLVEAVSAAVPDGSRVVEFHAGVGALGLGIATRQSSHVFNEIGAESLRGLELGIAAMPEVVRARLKVFPGVAADHLRLVHDADVVITDPPRKGVEGPLLARLCERPPKRWIGVWCGYESFEREAEAALASGRFRLVDLAGFALFPFTDHVEVMAAFERR